MKFATNLSELACCDRSPFEASDIQKSKNKFVTFRIVPQWNRLWNRLCASSALW